ncbi:GNAT family N-acetyltransferase [Paenibacillus sp. M1]|uniref:GNAT family N-acetyltransferase n=1 Tax=Paenibacillus haidiansis TaxID=1574488 RepID=A0ABU7VR64_9BACL
MTDLKIRKAVENDEAFLSEMLFLSLFTPEGQEPFSKDILTDPSISKYVDGWGRDDDIGFIALIDDEPVGSVAARFFSENNKGYGFVDSKTPELGMAIRTEHRGKGIGSVLLNTILKELKDRGIDSVSLSVDPGNPVLRLYKRFGFIQVGMVGTSITMIKNL